MEGTQTMEIKKRGEKWQARFRWYSDGKQYSKSRTFTLKTDAEAWIIDQKKKQQQGQVKRDTAFLWYYDDYIETYQTGIAENTKIRWTQTKKHFKNYFGKNRTIQSLTTHDLQQFTNYLAKNHTKSSVITIIRPIKQVLSQAVHDGYLPRNPMNGIKYTGAQPRAVTYLNENQTKKLIKYITSHRWQKREGKNKPIGTPYAILTALLTGARFSEVAGLRWNDLNEKEKKITIEHQLNQGGQITKTKTEASKRSIPVTQSLIEQLKGIRDPDDGDDDLIFKGRFNNFIKETSTNLLLKRILKNLQIDAPNYHFHSLRHTHVALLINHNVDIYTISKRLGHKNFSITLKHYAYLIDEKKVKDNKKIIKILNNLY